MSLSNSPDPAVREAIVRQDLDNVLHPIAQHKVLETKQMVVTGGDGSTIVDADGTEYLDAMAGLWCVNIGYGRTELAEVAADQMRQLSYFPHTAMNVPAAALAEKINTLMGGGYHTYFVTICASMIAINTPVPIAKTPIQSRNRAASSGGLAADAAGAAAGRTGAVPGTSRRASANRPSLPRRNVSTKVIGGVR